MGKIKHQLKSHAFTLKRGTSLSSNGSNTSHRKRKAPPTSIPTRVRKEMLNKFDLVQSGFMFLVMVIFIILPLTIAEARWSLTPRLYVQGEYDDNIFLTERNTEDDFTTTISPGVNFAYETPTDQIILDYEFQRVLYDDFSEFDYSGHRGTLEARKDFGPWFTAGIREVIIRSQDPIELIGITEFERPSIRRGRRNRYTRNVVRPEAIFRFGENRWIRVRYRNNILRNKADDIADQDENAVNAILNLRLNIHNGFELFYEHINQNYGSTIPPEPSADYDGNEVRGRYTYYLDPRTSAFLEYRYYRRDFKRESPGFLDYEVNDARLGFSRDLYENVSLSVSGGYGVNDAKTRKKEETFSGRTDLTAQYKRLSVAVYGEGGFGEDFISAETLGLYEFWRTGFNGRYQLLETLWAEGFFLIEEDDFVDLDRRDTLLSVRGGLTYQIVKWLLLSFEYGYNERDSNVPFESFRDNRYIGRITAQYDIAERFQ